MLCGASLAAWLACSPDDPLADGVLARALELEVDCGPLTYQNFGAGFFAHYCLRCHNAALVGDLNRSDAPNEIDFNRLDGIRTFQRRIRLRAGVQGDMPPRLLNVPRPSELERMQLIQWIDCGLPSDAEVDNH